MGVPVSGKRWYAALTALVLAVTALAGTPSAAAPQPRPAPQASYTNPVQWEDMYEADVIMVEDAYYYSASTMHYSPGAPILRSYDLVHWEYAGHSVPRLDFGAKYDLNGGRAYIRGVWAS